MSYSSVYTSTSVNRNSNIADWAQIQREDVFAFASHKSIAISTNLNSQKNKINHLIQTNATKVINVLKFVHNSTNNDNPFLVVGDQDGNSFIYSASTSNDNQLSWNLLLTLPKSKGQITAIGGLKPRNQSHNHDFKIQKDVLLIATSEGLISSWELDLDPKKPSFSLLQTINLKGPLPLDLALTLLPTLQKDGEGKTKVEYLLALGLTDRRVRIWTGETVDDKIQFSPKLILEGHEDWIRSLDFCETIPSSTSTTSNSSSSSALMLASGSQDNSIRLWRIRQVSLDDSSSSSETVDLSSTSQNVKGSNSKDEFDVLAAKLERDISSNQGGISNKAHIFYTNESSTAKKTCWAVTFDALLVGHDDKITGVKWHPTVTSSSSNDSNWQPAALLSSSSDNSLILWSPSSHSSTSTSSKSRLKSYLPSFDSSQSDESSGVWLPEIRFGEIGGTGTSSLGYYGGLFSPITSSDDDDDPTASLILAHGWGGATHLWSRSNISSTSNGKSRGEDSSSSLTMKPNWNQVNAFTGHFMGVKSVCWERNGRWFLSASQDRTTRLHGIHRSSNTNGNFSSSWHEVARPQTHGYDLSSVTFLDRDGLSFASASDEKVVRLFQAPKQFVSSMKKLSKRNVSISQDLSSKEGGKNHSKSQNFLLILNVPDLATFSNPGVFSDQLTNATNRTEGKLTIIVASSLLKGLGTDEDCSLSFRQVEDFLKYCYSSTFGIAVKQDRLMLDINVLLLPIPSSSPSSSIWESLTKTSSFIPNEIEVVSSMTEKESTLSSVIPEEVIESNQIKIHHSTPSSATIQFIPKESTDGKSNETRVPFPRHDGIALGGTFDHIHVGHKILLSMAALVARKKIIVGVTGESMLSKKSNAHLLESLSQRLTSVRSFLTFFLTTLSPLDQQIVELADVCGPAGSEEDLQAMLLTEETASGGDMIASTRSERNLSSLEWYTIGVIGKDGEAKVKGKDAKEMAAAKVGSTAIREWFRKKIENEENKVGEKLRENLDDDDDDDDDDGDDERALNASVPALGLSNRAVYEDKKSFPEESNTSTASTSKPKTSIETLPPHEDILHLSTLWPELDKLYGHGYELLSINSSPDSRLIATTCKAQSEKHAVIRIYDSKKRWEEITFLPGHSLSITRVKFSPNGQFLISGSRDRTLRLWRIQEKENSDDIEFILIGVEKAHARIIWDLAWDNETDFLNDPKSLKLNGNWSGLFATASRDKSVKIWQMISDGSEDSSSKPYVLRSTIKLNDSVTSIAFGSNHTLAMGMESGDVVIYQPSSKGSDFEEWTSILELKQHHTETVSQLSFRPRESKELNEGSGEKDEDGWEHLMLVSAGLDGAVRLIEIKT